MAKISNAKVKKAKILFDAGDNAGALDQLREFRYSLERLDKRLDKKRTPPRRRGSV